MKKHQPEDVDVDFSPEDELGDIGAAVSKVQKLKEELAQVKTERQEYLDGWQRCKADSVNAKKEMTQSHDRHELRVREGFMDQLLPALDSFDMAAGSPSWDSVDSQWRSGMEQVRNQLLQVVSSLGISRYGEISEAYNPHLHDVVGELSEEGTPSQTIIKVMCYGYKTGDRVIRPAQVIIQS